MGIVELILTSLGLAMDAFAVAVCKGLSMGKMRWKDALVIALYFGVFQAGMPLIGFFLGVQFQEAIASVDHWVSFALLAVIGINMIHESFKKDTDYNPSINIRTMLVLALATSLDALAVGVTLAFLQVDIILAVACIGVTAFILSVIGVKIGNVFGDAYKSRAERVGGIILILMGIKILLEHTGIISW